MRRKGSVFARRLHNRFLKLRVLAAERDTRERSWLFLATLPNSGSTALARIMETSKNVSILQSRAEGQWLIPEMCRPRDRWQAGYPVDWALVRAVWLHHALRRSGGQGIVFEKSPPNIMRMRELVDTFSDMDPHVLLFTRDPIAICASWAKRYDAAHLKREWLPIGSPPLDSADAYFRTLGRLCGERMSILAGLKDLPHFLLSYERLTESSASWLSELRRTVPALSDINVSASIAVKDYAPQPLRNMNQEQRATLTEQQRAWLGEGLEPHADSIRSFGYTLD
jgi:hypothetical protein